MEISMNKNKGSSTIQEKSLEMKTPKVTLIFKRLAVKQTLMPCVISVTSLRRASVA